MKTLQTSKLALVRAMKSSIYSNGNSRVFQIDSLKHLYFRAKYREDMNCYSVMAYPTNPDACPLYLEGRRFTIRVGGDGTISFDGFERVNKLSVQYHRIKLDVVDKRERHMKGKEEAERIEVATPVRNERATNVCSPYSTSVTWSYSNFNH